MEGAVKHPTDMKEVFPRLKNLRSVLTEQCGLSPEQEGEWHELWEKVRIWQNEDPLLRTDGLVEDIIGIASAEGKRE